MEWRGIAKAKRNELCPDREVPVRDTGRVIYGRDWSGGLQCFVADAVEKLPRVLSPDQMRTELGLDGVAPPLRIPCSRACGGLLRWPRNDWST